MKKFIFTFKKHLFPMPDENMYFKTLRRGTTTFAALILPILLLLYTGQVWGATHILTEAMGKTIYPATFNPDAKPGDTIIIDKNRKSNIVFKNFDGTITNPYTFTNPSDSKVTINTGTTNAIQFYDSDNFILIGNNYTSETYGIEIDGATGTIRGGIRMWRCADWEVAYIYIHDTTAGISQNNNDPWTESDSMGDCHVHHLLIEDTNGTYAEGMYFGKTKVGDHPKFTTLEINDCYIYRTGSDGIQAGKTSGWLKIHGNYLEDVGTQNDTGQNFGIVVAFEAVGAEVYRNKIVRSRHNGIEIHSSASEVSIHDNVIWNAGYATTANGIKINPSIGTSTVINNTVVGSSGYGIKTDEGDTTGENRYNLLVANGSGGISSSYTTMNDNRIVASTTTEHFRDANAGDFSLTENSPTRDAVQGGGVSPIDHAGSTRPYSSTAPDIGAYEYYGPQLVPVKGLKVKVIK